MVLGCALLMVCAAESQAQTKKRIGKEDLGWIYSTAQFAREFEGFLDREGREVALRPLDRLVVPSDTLGPWILAQVAKVHPPPPPPPWNGEVHSWQVIRPEERLQYRALFSSTDMAYVGNDRFEPADTTATPRIRAKMQEAYGPPTETIVEAQGGMAEVEYIQFEYWFMVNDTIPIVVMDAYGPFDHGIVFAGDHRIREQLRTVRRGLLGQTIREGAYGAYVDYFYDETAEQWYRTGFDGTDFFVRPTHAPDLAQGRPELE